MAVHFVGREPYVAICGRRGLGAGGEHAVILTTSHRMVSCKSCINELERGASAGLPPREEVTDEITKARA